MPLPVEQQLARLTSFRTWGNSSNSLDFDGVRLIKELLEMIVMCLRQARSLCLPPHADPPFTSDFRLAN